ncbi:hypothetical protein [Sphingomonas jatrophae]|uniref:Uncharacterized protein n=1 Tax=Sphingomonas jatrophae TaxID=1166337 RepID=A0A1I6LS16_9SPHN|nr:hypothetical protein [Sphingomonas jatrophae]SFS06218.1 hypothetical protein SAMN05192580_3192 [Sphingomonas jatrophae]
MSLILALLLQAAAGDPLAEGKAALKKSIVDAIRNCPVATDGTVAVCSRDRGYAEGSGRRLQKLEKPRVVTNGPAITVTVGDGQTAPTPQPRDEDERIDARTRSRLTGRRE